MMNPLYKPAAGIIMTIVIFYKRVMCKPVGVIKKECFGDICNKWSDIQFCSDIFKMCRNCEEVVHDCGTESQPPECFQFCISHYAKLEQEKVKNSTCNVPSITNGMVVSPDVNANGRVTIHSKVTFSCQEGFQLHGSRSRACLGNDNWTEKDFPVCIDDSYLVTQCHELVLSISCTALFVVNIILLIMCFLNIKEKRRLKKASAANCKNESGSEIDESRSLLDTGIAHEEKEAESSIRKSEPSSSQKSNLSSSLSSEPTAEATVSAAVSASSSSASMEKNVFQAVGNQINLTLLNVHSKDFNNTDINTNRIDKEPESTSNLYTRFQKHQQEDKRATNKSVTEESQETVVAYQETQKTLTGKETGTAANGEDYARQEPNLIGYKDRSFAATGSRCNETNCPIN